MVTTLNFKDVVDLPTWKPLANTQTIFATGEISQDMRNNEDRHPYIFVLSGMTVFHTYAFKNDEWIILSSPGLGSSSSQIIVMPAQGPRGTIAAGATTTSIPLTTALPATVGVNQLANRGDGRGFKVRIIGNVAGSSGKTEERIIIGNSGGLNPTITLDSPLSFVPANGDAYEFLSGRVFLIGTSSGAGSWKYYDILTNSFSGNLATANLPASWIDSSLIGLDELLVPYDRNPGEGFLNILTATASGAVSLTGQAVGGDAGLLADQYRNFQIRIVEDTGTPTAAGQRRNITTHTAGPSPVYTVPAWAVQPSANAIYVIENNGDRIIEWSEGSTITCTYTISTNTWGANTIFTARPATGQCWAVQPFGIEDPTLNCRHSYIFVTRGSTVDILDIAGAATGTWTAAVQIQGFGSIPSYAAYEPATNQGRYVYIVPVNTERVYRIDLQNRFMEALPAQKGFSLQTNSNVRNISRCRV